MRSRLRINTVRIALVLSILATAFIAIPSASAVSPIPAACKLHMSFDRNSYGTVWAIAQVDNPGCRVWFSTEYIQPVGVPRTVGVTTPGTVTGMTTPSSVQFGTQIIFHVGMSAGAYGNGYATCYWYAGLPQSYAACYAI